MAEEENRFLEISTRLDILRDKNDKYHRVVDKIFEDGDLPVELKSAFGTQVQKVFRCMVEAESVIKEHYEPEI